MGRVDTPAPMPRSLLLAVLVLAAGCAGSDAPRQDDATPADLEVVIGQGGGVTGAWTGHRLHRDGTVERWAAAPGADRAFEPAGALEVGAVADVWRDLEAVTRSDEVRAPGNLSRTLEITADGRTRRSTWEPGAHAPLDDAWTRVAARLASAR